MKTILFRADSSSVIGTGHIMRDLVLAKQYAGSKVIFATQDLEGNLNSKILESGYIVENLNSNNLDELNVLVKNLSIDMLVIDHYGIDNVFEQALKASNPMMKILCFDDTYEKHYCDIVLNHNIYADSKKYINLVPKHCEIRCGTKYTLLRNEFLSVNLLNKKHENKKMKIFIAMGGADSKHINISLLDWLKDLPITIELVTTFANKNLEELKSYTKKDEKITLYIDAYNIANIIQECDIALVTPSVMVNEIIFLKIPFISIMVTENQYYMDTFLRQEGFPCINSKNLHLIPSLIKSFDDEKYYVKQLNQINNITKKRIHK